jgi:precorrin-8X/cobalt-precorrin-8 methylmutase
MRDAGVLFDSYVIVDWSAARAPKTGRDSIWICRLGPGGETVANPPTRHAARELLAAMLEEATNNGERVVAGFDFPFGYPAGFATRLGLAGPPWRAVWDELAALVEDRADNHNNRFQVGAALNRRVSGAAFPFWGCPAGSSEEFLGTRHHRGHGADEPLKERRLIDEWMVGAQPCWKLAYTGSVGSQVLTGLPVVRALRDDTRWAAHARIWPFETGLGAGDARIVFAEVWPSWWRACAKLGPPNDKAQVRTVARIFSAADRAGQLAAWFSPDIGVGDLRRIVEEEAWTLGVTAPRMRRSSLPSSPRKRGPEAGRVFDPGVGDEAVALSPFLHRGGEKLGPPAK